MGEDRDIKDIGYFLSISKQTAMTGEVITVNTNLPFNTTSEQLSDEIVKITSAIDKRLESVNTKVLAKTAETLRKQGVSEKEIERVVGKQPDHVI
jgi:hypothetical protein